MKLLTVKEAAKLIDGLTPHRVRRLCHEKKIIYHKFGSKFMIADIEILKYFGLAIKEKDAIIEVGNTLRDKGA